MYNHDQKVAFIRAYTVSVRVAKTLEMIFTSIEPIEVRFGTDLCTFTDEQMQSVSEALGGSSSSALLSAQTYIRAYAKWCVGTNKPGARKELTTLRLVSSLKMAEKMVAGPLDLQRVLDSVLTPESDLTADNIIRAYFWLVFAGIRREDIDTLTAENVDLTRMEVRVGHLTFPIYRQAEASIRNAVELTAFRYIHPLYEPVMKQRYPGRRIMRMIKSDIDHGEIEKMFSRKCAASNLPVKRHFSYVTLRKSGFFYRYYMLEREGVADPFNEAAYGFIGPDRLSSSEAKYQTTRALYRDYLMWKDAFRV